MSADEAVGAGMEYELEPGHVDEHEGGTAPLACLEEDDADGLACEALLLHDGEHVALGWIEMEWDDAAGGLVADSDAGGAPVLEVAGEACEGKLEVGVEVAVGQGCGDVVELAGLGAADFDALAEAADASQGVVGRAGEGCLALLIFFAKLGFAQGAVVPGDFIPRFHSRGRLWRLKFGRGVIGVSGCGCFAAARGRGMPRPYNRLKISGGGCCLRQRILLIGGVDSGFGVHSFSLFLVFSGKGNGGVRGAQCENGRT